MEKTIRQKIFDLLTLQEQDVRNLSQMLGISEKEVLQHLAHVDLSARKKGLQLVIVPSNCLTCGFTFKDRQRLQKPSRCPKCKSTHLASPGYLLK